MIKRISSISVLLFLLVVIVLPPIPTQAADSTLAYPVLSNEVQYYQTTFPAGLKYSPGWYGTFTYAPPASKIILFDDDSGICIFSMSEGITPTGAQGGTVLKTITLKEANAIITSYPLRKLVKPFDAEIIAVMKPDHFFAGTWAGEKLKQKWSCNLQAIPDSQLTPKQKEYEAATKDIDIKQVDLSKFDPNRYWVANSGNWSDNVTHWSSSSGGTPGASLPTSADNVYFDANSFTAGSQTVTIDAAAYCLDMDWTGATNTPTLAGNQILNISGSLTFIAGMNVTLSYYITFLSSSLGKKITTAGLSLGTLSYFFFNAPGSWTLQDSLNLGSGTLAFRGGTLDTNGQTITCGTFTTIQSNTRTLTLGASVVNCTSWWADKTNLTLNEGTSSIRVTGTGTFAGGGETYYEVQLNGTAHTISDSNTFTNLILKADTTQTITFTDGTLQTITTPTMTGSVGKVKTLQGSGTAGWSIAKSGGGQVSLDYLSISYSAASPADTWYAGAHSTDGGGNSGWMFIAITISAATNIEATTATLNGNITATGGENCTVNIYWGTSNGGTTWSSWSNNSSPTSPSQPQGVEAFYLNTTSLPSGTTIYFSASANNTGGISWPAASLSFLTKPAAPTGVSATDGSSTDNITITFNAVAGADTYTIWRNSDNLTVLTGSANTTFVDTTADAGTITGGAASATDGSQTAHITLSLIGASANNGTTYAYRVQAYNASGLSDNSTPDNGYRGVGSLTVQWDVSSDNSTFSPLAGGTTDPYNDTTAPAGTITPGAATASDNTSSSYVTVTAGGQSTTDGAVRYYLAELSATGAVSANSTSDDGYRGVGSLTPQVQRSAADSDAGYSNITGATSVPYNDTGAPSNGDGRYYQIVWSASGAVSANSTSDRGCRIPSTAAGVAYASSRPAQPTTDQTGDALLLGIAELLLFGLSALAFWKRYPVLFAVLACISIMTGLYMPRLLGQANLGMSVGLMLVAYALFCVGMTYKNMLAPVGREE